MKYAIHGGVAPEVGAAIEDDPQQIQKMIGKWQELEPLGMWFSLTRRYFFVIVDVPNEDAFFGALATTWRTTNSYPTVEPLANVAEFPELLARAAG